MQNKTNQTKELEMDKETRKQKGGAEKQREKKRKALEAEAASTSSKKITHVFWLSAVAASSSAD